jgi:hypothetical protein
MERIRELLKRPLVAGILGGLVGLLVGLIWAYGISPVKWINVPPVQLGTTYQEQYLRMAIDSYQVRQDDTLALQRFQSLETAGTNILKTIENNPGSQDPNAILKFSSLVSAASAVGLTPAPAINETPAPTAPKTGSLTILVIFGAIVAFAVVGFVIIRYLYPLLRNTAGGVPTAATRERDITNQTTLTDYAAKGEEPPIAQFVTTYVLGDDLFDDSFSIDSPAGEFLGECGIGISETIGVGEPKKVQAFEVWLFDKNDIQTVTKVLMSPHAFNDVATFQRLQAKGEPFMVERGKQVILETAALQLVATVSDMEFGDSALPEDSYFDRLTLEIAVWPKPTTPA